jgi:mRNA interferase MazF
VEIKMAREIRRGEIYWVDWSPGRGSEQKGIRPALVIQNDSGNKFSPNTIVASVTTAIDRLYTFQVKVAPEESGLPQLSIVDLASLETVDKGRLKEKCGELSPEKISQVDGALKVSLGLE